MKSAWDWKWKLTEQFDHFCALCEGNLSDWCTFQNTKQSHHLIKKVLVCLWIKQVKDQSNIFIEFCSISSLL